MLKTIAMAWKKYWTLMEEGAVMMEESKSI